MGKYPSKITRSNSRMSLKLALSLLILLQTINSYHVHCLDNGLARTPPMGWIAWERFTCNVDCDNYPDSCISSQLFKRQADWMISGGYNKAGYEYINIDDCWEATSRDPVSGRLLPDAKRFAGGIEELAQYIHGKGLKFGMYGNCGTKSCDGYPAQLKTEANLSDNYFNLDSQTFANWQIDSFKFDNCYLNPALAESICPDMSRALMATGRPILLTCQWPDYMLKIGLQPDWDLVAKSCNSWRYYKDILDSWQSVEGIIDSMVGLQDTIVHHHGPGSWFDPDMLVIGNFGLSFEQAQAQMAIWSIWSAPMFMSNDLSKMEDKFRQILINGELISVNQDRMGVLGLMVDQTDGDSLAQAFVKPIEPIKNGCPSFAIVYLYRAVLGDSREISFELGNLLKRSALSVAAERYKSLHGSAKPGGDFSAEECLNRLNGHESRRAWPRISLTSTRVLSNSTKSHSELKAAIKYDVFDLIEHKSVGQVSTDSRLSLTVNVSGVRAVRLSEIN